MSKGTPTRMEVWVRTDEAEDVAGSVRHVIRTAHFVGEDPQSWKWVVIALHSALQGACVCHLTTTAAPVGAVERRNAQDWLAYFDRSATDAAATPPKTHLMGFVDLLKAVRKPNSAGDGSDVRIAISDSELGWLRKFHEDIRNQFTHFEPMGWSIDMSGIPEIAKLVARIIGDILDTGWAFRHLDSEQSQDLRRDVQALVSVEWPFNRAE